MRPATTSWIGRCRPNRGSRPEARASGHLALVEEALDLRGLRQPGVRVERMHADWRNGCAQADDLPQPPLQILLHRPAVCGKVGHLDHDGELLAAAFTDALDHAEELAVAALILCHRD